MNEEKEIKNGDENEFDDIDIEELTKIQGGVEEKRKNEGCGLGCYQGAGYTN